MIIQKNSVPELSDQVTKWASYRKHLKERTSLH